LINVVDNHQHVITLGC